MSTSRWTWLEVGCGVAFLLALAAAWRWTPLSEWASPQRLGDALEPYRTRWIGLPLVLGLFVVAELFLFPVLVLIFACGLAFGPWLGPGYALAGAVAGAILPFFLGRRLGRKRLLTWGGEPARKLAKALDKKGLLAVYLVRKVPAPYTPVNMLCGACGVPFTDFVVGTALGMCAGVILLTVLGAQVGGVLGNPRGEQLWLAAGVLLCTVSLAFFLQRALNRRIGKAA